MKWYHDKDDELPDEIKLPRYISYSAFNCLAFALGIYNDWMTLEESLPKDIDPWEITDEMVEDALTYIFQYHNINARIVVFPEDVDEDEYLAILRYEPLESSNIPIEFHAIRQTSDGRWFHKAGELAVEECNYSLDTKEGDCWSSFEEPKNVSSDIYIAVKQSNIRPLTIQSSYPIDNTTLYTLYTLPADSKVPSSLKLTEDLEWYADYEEVKSLQRNSSEIIISGTFNVGIAVSEISSTDSSQVLIYGQFGTEYGIDAITLKNNEICYALSSYIKHF